MKDGRVARHLPPTALHASPFLPLLQLRDPEWIKYVLPKGFIAVDGCSLTIGEVTDATFSVYLIPETLRCVRTGVGGWQPWWEHWAVRGAAAERTHNMQLSVLRNWGHAPPVGLLSRSLGPPSAGGPPSAPKPTHPPAPTQPTPRPTPTPPSPRRCTVLGDKGVGDLVNVEVETQTQAIVDTVERVLQQYLERKGL